MKQYWQSLNEAKREEEAKKEAKMEEKRRQKNADIEYEATAGEGLQSRTPKADGEDGAKEVAALRRERRWAFSLQCDS